MGGILRHYGSNRGASRSSRGARIQEMVVHFLVQLCEQSVPGIFWGHALPVPEFGELFKAGVKEADAPAAL